MKMIYATVAALAAATTVPASAAAIETGQWYSFISGPGGFYSGDGTLPGYDPASVAAPDPSWTFTLGALGGTITVLDGYASGYRFSIDDFGMQLGTTTLTAEGLSCGQDISACLANPMIGKGIFALSAGDHSISGHTVEDSFNTAAFFRVDEIGGTAVPEPIVWVTMLLGFGSIGYTLRRREPVRRASVI